MPIYVGRRNSQLSIYLLCIIYSCLADSRAIFLISYQTNLLFALVTRLPCKVLIRLEAIDVGVNTKLKWFKYDLLQSNLINWQRLDYLQVQVKRHFKLFAKNMSRTRHKKNLSCWMNQNICIFEPIEST